MDKAQDGGEQKLVFMPAAVQLPEFGVLVLYGIYCPLPKPPAQEEGGSGHDGNAGSIHHYRKPHGKDYPVHSEKYAAIDKDTEAFQKEKSAHYKRGGKKTFRRKAEHLLNRKVPEIYRAYNDYTCPNRCKQHID